MKAATMFRTSSGYESAGFGFSYRDQIAGICFPVRCNRSMSLRIINQVTSSDARDSDDSIVMIRRTRSDTNLQDLILKGSSESGLGRRMERIGSSVLGNSVKEISSSLTMLQEEAEEVDNRFVISKKRIGNSAQENELIEELGFGEGGNGKGKKVGGGNGGGNNGGTGKSGMNQYYEEMLKENPTNPLLLRNYGKFLHEVVKDAGKAEECYERAILESPGDGEILSLYAKLIWESRRDDKRAESYFDQAIKAAPDDCYVLGSYAHFLWDAEEEEQEDGKFVEPSTMVVA